MGGVLILRFVAGRHRQHAGGALVKVPRPTTSLIMHLWTATGRYIGAHQRKEVIRLVRQFL